MTQAMPLPTFDAPVRHPAKYSPDLLRVMRSYLKPGWKVYDPFGGVGGIHRIASSTSAQTFAGEIEYRVIANARGTRSIVANAMYLPFAGATFDAIATSPTYGNRMGDASPRLGSAHKWKIFSYRLTFGFELHPDNTGTTQFSAKYKRIHEQAWAEAVRVLKPGGLFLLNISDHIRAGQRVYVSAWHLNTLRGMGLQIVKTHAVKTPRMGKGENRNARTACEYVFILSKP